ncbi:MAG: hypothetical protein JSS43_23285 [Proteobacteria bacterium]|nr:hypothetical protein [Pseudomonadota bacterium]
MSETSTVADAVGATGAGSSEPKLYSPTGEPLRSSGWRPNRSQPDQLGDFVQQQPMTAALVALVVGYFLGKLT